MLNFKAEVFPVDILGFRLAGDVFTESYTSASFADKNVGNGKTVSVSAISISGTDAGNYSLTNTTATTTANISARSIMVTADGKSKIYGATDPPLTYRVTSGSLVNGDSFTGALTRATGENAGTYIIQQGTLTAGLNYNLTFIPGTLTILYGWSGFLAPIPPHDSFNTGSRIPVKFQLTDVNTEPVGTAHPTVSVSISGGPLQPQGTAEYNGQHYAFELKTKDFWPAGPLMISVVLAPGDGNTKTVTVTLTK